MTKELNLKLFITVLLSLFICSATWAKRNVIEELSLPIDAYQHTDQHTESLPISGELVLTLEYWDHFTNPDNNNYTLRINGYSNSSRSVDSRIFDSHLPGTSPNNVQRGQWRNATWKEMKELSGEFTHIIYLTINDLWETRCGFTHDGHIILTYGRLTDKGQLNHAKLIHVKGGVETWNKLVRFLRNAHSHNIGKTL